MPLVDFPRVPTETLLVNRPSNSTGVTPSEIVSTGTWMTSGDGNPPAFTAASTPVSCDHTTVGAIRRTVRPTEAQLVTRFVANEDAIVFSGHSKEMWSYMLVDVLNRQGGLLSNTAVAQTTNLPTAALTRYTDGVGVVGYMEVTSQFGSTASVVTVTYTNQAGTSGRTGVIYVPGTQRVGSCPQIHLASGDSGIRSVESIQFTPATGTDSTCGIMLVKPLAVFSVNHAEELTAKDIVGWNTGVHPDACLMLLTIDGAITGRCNAQIDLADPQ
jgi:hypothetical protein